MNSYVRGAAIVAVALGAAGCHDFLTGGDLSTNPNAPETATAAQLFVGVHSNISDLYTSFLPRFAGVLAQHFTGTSGVYSQIDQYVPLPEAQQNILMISFYGPGALVDVRRLETMAAATHDSVFLGMAQVQEALLMGLATEVYGDLVYSKALTGMSNPPLDPQLAVYDSLQSRLSRAVTNMSATGPTNGGPGSADVALGGSAAAWTALAHTLKARFYMHTGEVRGTAAYQSALTEAPLGILDPAGDYKAVFSGITLDENPWFQFMTGDRFGYVIPGRMLDTLLRSRQDPRRTDYFTIDPTTDSATELSATRLLNTYPQPIATAVETHLLWAEAAYRTGDEGTALTQLNTARGFAALPNESPSLSGDALLTEILTEEYIADFQLGVEGWRMYRRTCAPNLLNRSGNGQPMLGRLFYDLNERLTNSSIPLPGTPPNGSRNADDPANSISDAGGSSCLAGA